MVGKIHANGSHERDTSHDGSRPVCPAGGPGCAQRRGVLSRARPGCGVGNAAGPNAPGANATAASNALRRPDHKRIRLVRSAVRIAVDDINAGPETLRTKLARSSSQPGNRRHEKDELNTGQCVGRRGSTRVPPARKYTIRGPLPRYPSGDRRRPNSGLTSASVRAHTRSTAILAQDIAAGQDDCAARDLNPEPAD
jgi:hypothetical protein